MCVTNLWRVGCAAMCIAVLSRPVFGQPKGTSTSHNHHHASAHAGHAHDGHHLCEHDIEMPKDYASAVARIKKCRISIGQELASGHVDAVHAPLDEATIILNKLMPLARDSGVPKAQWQEINLAAKDLKKRLADLHAAIDAERKVDFKSAAIGMDQAIRRLELVARTPTNSLTR